MKKLGLSYAMIPNKLWFQGIGGLEKSTNESFPLSDDDSSTEVGSIQFVLEDLIALGKSTSTTTDSNE